MSEICPNDFFDGAPPRAIGTECEYWVQPKDLSPVADDSTAKVLSDYMEGFLTVDNVVETTSWPAVQTDSKVWLANGAKIYADMDSCLEYCTPEALGPFNAAATDIEGQLIMQRLTHQSPDTRVKGGLFRRVGNIALGSSSPGDYETETRYYTNGYHQNLITPDRFTGSVQSVEEMLNTYAATRFFAWSGMVGIDGFKLSQKAAGIGMAFDFRHYCATTEGKKPIGVIRDNSTGWSRVEIRYADAVHSPWSVFMNLATASLVLRLAEHGPHYPEIYDSLPTLKWPVEDISTINARGGLSQKLQTEDHGGMLAVDIQERYALAARALSEEVSLPRDEVMAIDEWLNVCHDLRAIQRGEASYHILADRVEWAARRAHLEKNIGRFAVLNESNFSAIQADILWDHCNPAGKSSRYWGRHQTGLAKQLNNVVVSHQISLTPRAVARGGLIAQLSENTGLRINGWGSAYMGDGATGEEIKAISPYDLFTRAQNEDSLSPKQVV